MNILIWLITFLLDTELESLFHYSRFVKGGGNVKIFARGDDEANYEQVALR